MFQAASVTKKTSSSFGSKKDSKNEPRDLKGSKTGPSKMAKAAKSTTLKAKTLIDAMQTLNLIPSFSTSNFGGDVLPENILIKNILDGMVASLETLSLIVEGNDTTAFMEDPMLKEMKPYLMKLNMALGLVHGKGDFGSTLKALKVEEYDADTEGLDEHKHGKKLKRSKASVRSGTTTDSEPQDVVGLEDKMVVRACRDILLVIQNDQRQASIMSRALSLKKIENPAMSNFLSCLSEMVEYAKCVVTLPYSTHLTEIDSLCGSIFMSQKLQKTIRKIQGTLDEVHANHAKLTAEKTIEKDALDESVKQVRSKTTSHINDMHTVVDDKIKTMAWNSHARQTKAMEACSKLKREFDESLGEHVISETELRHENIRLETEISQMIKEFDAAMFDKYHAIDNISAEYSLEKVELEDARKALDDIEAEKEFIIEKQRKLEEEERAAQLLIIRRNVAAKVIQRAYRNYLARKLLKKKKKKKKAAAS